MGVEGQSFVTDAVAGSDEIVMRIPGVEPADGVTAHLVNADAGRGLVASIIHLKPGTHIPAHVHAAFAEAHYVLEGDLVNDGVELGVGGYVTHGPGVVHGPHSSKGGCRVLTIQTGHAGPEQSDHKVIEGAGASAS